MSRFEARVRHLLEAKRKEFARRHPGICKAPVTARPPAINPGKRTVLGRDSNGVPLRLDEISRREHMHVIGTTGAGKTNLIEHMVKQDILNGRGALVVDAHGNNPDSLFRRLVTWSFESGVAKSRTIHLLDPNNPDYTTGFNPLALPEGHDPAVIAEAGLEAFQRLWADEDPDSKPTIQRLLPAVLTVLSERGLTLAEALTVLDPDDREGIRELLLDEVKDEYAHNELQWLKDMGADRTGRRDLRIEMTGPRNRIAKLLRASAIRTMVGQTERVIDLREVMDNSHIVLANLAGGARVYEQAGDLLGRLLVRFLAFHAKRRRRPDIPFGVYLDECQRYLSGDVPVILAEMRKQGVMMLLAHQWSSQLAKVDEEILSAVRNATNVKAVFRVKDPAEATELAEMVIPLNLETPVAALNKETIVGYELGRMRNASMGQNITHTSSSATTKTRGTGITRTEGESVGESLTRTESEQESVAHTSGQSHTVGVGEQFTRGITHSHAESDSHAESEGETFGRGTSRSRGGSRSEQDTASRGSNFSQSFDVPVDAWRSGEGAYGRAAAWGEASDRNVTAGYDSGSARSTGSAENWSDGESESEAYTSQSSRSSGVTDGVAESESEGNSYSVSDTESESVTYGTTYGISTAKGKDWSRSKSTANSSQESTGLTTGESIGRGQSSSAGWSEALVPVLAMRPGSVHSKENVLYLAAQTLRSLPTGTCFINWVDRSGMQNALLRVPRLPALSTAEDTFVKLRRAIFEASPSALPVPEAEKRLDERRQRLLLAASTRLLAQSEPDEPATFRVPLGKRKGHPEDGV